MALTLALSGCVPEPEIYIRSAPSGLMFRICGPGVVESLEVETRPRSSPVADGWDPAWSIEGELAIDSSGDITYGDAPDGMTTGTPPRRVAPEEQNLLVRVVFAPSSQTGPRQISASFLADNELDGSWRNQSGIEIASACE